MKASTPSQMRIGLAGTITTDLLEFTNTQTRAETFQPFFDNVNA